MKETEQNKPEIDVLGMWIVEDLMRALDMDINKVEQYVIRPGIKVGESEEKDRQWFERIIAMMKAEGIEKSGHLKMCRDAVERLTARHKALLKDPRNKVYRDLYYDALPAIVDFRSRQQMPVAPHGGNHPETDGHQPEAASHHPEIESWLELLYGVKLLLLQGKPITQPTQQAAQKVQTLMDMLMGKSDSPSNNSDSSESSNN